MRIKKRNVLILVCCFWLTDVGAQNWSEMLNTSSSDGAEEDFFGRSVSISGDGSTALVGAYFKDVGEEIKQGQAYIFSRSGNTWSEEAILLASNGSVDDNFGFSVSLSNDGNTALIAAHHKDEGLKSLQGAVYVFVRSNGVWSEQSILMPSDGAYGDNFGYSLSLSADGNTCIVGAPRKIVGPNSQQGQGYIYHRSGNSWTEEVIFSAGDGAGNNFFGWDTYISGDGNTAVVGALGYGSASSYYGKAYVYVYSAGTWSFQAALLPDDPEYNSNYGFAVCLSYDGNTALVGAPDKTITGGMPQQGKVYLYKRSGTSWSQQTALVVTDGKALDRLGVALTLTADGNQAFVGSNVDAIGKVYQFSQSNEVWTQQSNCVSSDGTLYDFFSHDLSVSADGNTLLVSAYNKTVDFYNQGKIYVFSNSDITSAEKENEQAIQINCFPNPTSGKINVTLGMMYEQLEVELFSAVGTVLSKEHFSNCAEFEWTLPSGNGIYFLRIKNNETEKIVKVLVD